MPGDESVALDALRSAPDGVEAAETRWGGGGPAQRRIMAGAGPSAAAIQGQAAEARRTAVVAGFTGAFHALGLVLAALSTLGAVLIYLALAPRRADSGR